jgi:hypothetical protein
LQWGGRTVWTSSLHVRKSLWARGHELSRMATALERERQELEAAGAVVDRQDDRACDRLTRTALRLANKERAVVTAISTNTELLTSTYFAEPSIEVDKRRGLDWGDLDGIARGHIARFDAAFEVIEAIDAASDLIELQQIWRRKRSMDGQ